MLMIIAHMITRPSKIPIRRELSLNDSKDKILGILIEVQPLEITQADTIRDLVIDQESSELGFRWQQLINTCERLWGNCYSLMSPGGEESNDCVPKSSNTAFVGEEVHVQEVPLVAEAAEPLPGVFSSDFLGDQPGRIGAEDLDVFVVQTDKVFLCFAEIAFQGSLEVGR